MTAGYLQDLIKMSMRLGRLRGGIAHPALHLPAERKQKEGINYWIWLKAMDGAGGISSLSQGCAGRSWVRGREGSMESSGRQGWG